MPALAVCASFHWPLLVNDRLLAMDADKWYPPCRRYEGENGIPDLMMALVGSRGRDVPGLHCGRDVSGAHCERDASGPHYQMDLCGRDVPGPRCERDVS